MSYSFLPCLQFVQVLCSRWRWHHHYCIAACTSLPTGYSCIFLELRHPLFWWTHFPDQLEATDLYCYVVLTMLLVCREVVCNGVVLEWRHGWSPIPKMLALFRWVFHNFPSQVPFDNLKCLNAIKLNCPGNSMILSFTIHSSVANTLRQQNEGLIWNQMLRGNSFFFFFFYLREEFLWRSHSVLCI